jgi:hypothetical protein
MAWSSCMFWRRSPSARAWCSAKCARPAAFTVRIAASALRTSSSMRVPCEGASAMPMLQVSVKVGAVDAAGLRHDVQDAPRRGLGGGGVGGLDEHAGTNWSPPRRASRSSPRRHHPAGAAPPSCSTRVADVVAQAVVDLAEAVHVDHQAGVGAGFAAAPRRWLRPHCSASVTAVGQAGQRRAHQRFDARSAAMRSLRSRNDHTRPCERPARISGRVTRSSTWPVCSVEAVGGADQQRASIAAPAGGCA